MKGILTFHSSMWWNNNDTKHLAPCHTHTYTQGNFNLLSISIPKYQTVTYDSSDNTQCECEYVPMILDVDSICLKKIKWGVLCVWIPRKLTHDFTFQVPCNLKVRGKQLLVGNSGKKWIALVAQRLGHSSQMKY